MFVRGIAIVGFLGAGCGGGPAPGTADSGVAVDGPSADARFGADARLGGDARSGGDARGDSAIDSGVVRPDAPPPPMPVTAADPDYAGSGATLFRAGAADPDGPYFSTLGTNGRTCATCHDRRAGWTVTPAGLQARFDATGGTDPIFRLVDGAGSPQADVSTVAARRTAYAVLLDKALVRVGLPIPAGAEFTLAAVDDPYGYASAAELSLFRRILPATNLGFAATLMWDGREPTLAHQAGDATTGHAQAASADPQQMATIVAFESSLDTAQLSDSVAGALDGDGATGGPAALAQQAFQIGINDPDASGFTPEVFTLYGAWAGLTGSDPATQRKLAIARGEVLFNSKVFAITGVPGSRDRAAATCSTCHDTPGTGGHSLDETMSLGLDASGHRTSDLPLYTLRRTSDGTTVQTTDPGRALITGKWADIGKFQVPALRGLAMRAPYFHDGVAATLASVVNFYNTKFAIGMTAQEQADMTAFLEAL